MSIINKVFRTLFHDAIDLIVALALIVTLVLSFTDGFYFLIPFFVLLAGIIYIILGRKKDQPS